eukprot:SAG11_NODE_4579_length_1844_cov_2.286533_2_plen_184_part_00
MLAPSPSPCPRCDLSSSLEQSVLRTASRVEFGRAEMCPRTLSLLCAQVHHSCTGQNTHFVESVLAGRLAGIGGDDLGEKFVDVDKLTQERAKKSNELKVQPASLMCSVLLCHSHVAAAGSPSAFLVHTRERSCRSTSLRSRRCRGGARRSRSAFRESLSTRRPLPSQSPTPSTRCRACSTLTT